MKKMVLLSILLIIGFGNSQLAFADAELAMETVETTVSDQVRAGQVVEIDSVVSSGTRTQVTSPVNLDDPDILDYEVTVSDGGYQCGDQVYWPKTIPLSTDNPLFVYYQWRTIRNETFTLILQVNPKRCTTPDEIVYPENPDPLPADPGDFVIPGGFIIL